MRGEKRFEKKSELKKKNSLLSSFPSSSLRLVSRLGTPKTLQNETFRARERKARRRGRKKKRREVKAREKEKSTTVGKKEIADFSVDDFFRRKL